MYCLELKGGDPSICERKLGAWKETCLWTEAYLCASENTGFAKALSYTWAALLTWLQKDTYTLIIYTCTQIHTHTHLHTHTACTHYNALHVHICTNTYSLCLSTLVYCIMKCSLLVNVFLYHKSVILILVLPLCGAWGWEGHGGDQNIKSALFVTSQLS